MWGSWSEPLWWKEDEILLREDAFLAIMKTVLLKFSLFLKILDHCLLQEPLISMLASKLTQTF
jgi:hypothetical protein